MRAFNFRQTYIAHESFFDASELSCAYKMRKSNTKFPVRIIKIEFSKKDWLSITTNEPLKPSKLYTVLHFNSFMLYVVKWPNIL